MAPNLTLSPLMRQSAARARRQPAAQRVAGDRGDGRFGDGGDGVDRVATHPVGGCRPRRRSSVRSSGTSSPAEKISWPPNRIDGADVVALGRVRRRPRSISRYTCRVSALVGGRDSSRVPMPGYCSPTWTLTNSLTITPRRSPAAPAGCGPRCSGRCRRTRSPSCRSLSAARFGSTATIWRSTASTSATVRPFSESSWVHVGGSRKRPALGEVVERGLRAWPTPPGRSRCSHRRRAGRRGSAPTKK